MRHFLRLAALSLLVFLTISSYFLIPKPGDFWESASRMPVARGESKARLSIFLTSTKRPAEPAPVAPVQAEPAPPAESSPVEATHGIDQPRFSTPDRRVREIGSIELPPDFVADDAPEAADRVDAEELDGEGAEPGGSLRSQAAEGRGGASRPYTVRQGDSLSQIAARVLGSVRFVGDIRRINPGVTDQLKVGQTIRLPIALPESVAEPAPPREPAAEQPAEEEADRGVASKPAPRPAPEPAKKPVRAEPRPARGSAARPEPAASKPAPRPAPEPAKKQPRSEPRPAKGPPRAEPTAGKPAPRIEAKPAPATEKTVEVTVKSGDTWYGLAASHLGSGKRWPDILAANRARVEEGGPLVAGMKLVIPRKGKAIE